MTITPAVDDVDTRLSLLPAISAEFDISPFTILPSTIIADVTVLLLGVPMFTVEPRTIAK